MAPIGSVDQDIDTIARGSQVQMQELLLRHQQPEPERAWSSDVSEEARDCPHFHTCVGSIASDRGSHSEWVNEWVNGPS